MLAAENGALRGGKVGGIGDVVRDLPPALAELGCRPTVVTPAYGVFGRLPGAAREGGLPVAFGGREHEVDVYRVPGHDASVSHVAFEHPLFSPQGPGRIYCDDGPARPFATDAGKFAFFCAAAASWIGRLEPQPHVVHLHDWHAAFYCLLRRSDPQYAGLAGIRTVFTIHNLALQGVRPLDGDASSLAAWFPQLGYAYDEVVDPRYRDCINPMATAIRLADGLNTVSPTYAAEILEPNDPSRGFRGGEGLEGVLRDARSQGRLHGILNGCVYGRRDRRRPGWRRLLDTIDGEVAEWQKQAAGGREMHELARNRIATLPKRRPRDVLTSIGRLTDQKAALYLETLADGRSALEHLLEFVGARGALIMLGSGDPALESRMSALSREHANFLFLCGYSETVSELMYKAGDLFLMPSSFEPCGISQMLAMRDGQPCVVHAVGGLEDTVADGVDGFAFDGDSSTEQARGFVAAVERALTMKNDNPDAWLRIRQDAAAARFSWEASASRYIEVLYE